MAWPDASQACRAAVVSSHCSHVVHTRTVRRQTRPLAGRDGAGGRGVVEGGGLCDGRHTPSIALCWREVEGSSAGASAMCAGGVADGTPEQCDGQCPDRGRHGATPVSDQQPSGENWRIGYQRELGIGWVVQVMATICGLHVVGPREYNRLGITDRDLFSRPPPSTTRPSLRVEIWPEFARVKRIEAESSVSVTASITIGTAGTTRDHAWTVAAGHAQEATQFKTGGTSLRSHSRPR